MSMFDWIFDPAYFENPGELSLPSMDYTDYMNDSGGYIDLSNTDLDFSSLLSQPDYTNSDSLFNMDSSSFNLAPSSFNLGELSFPMNAGGFNSMSLTSSPSFGVVQPDAYNGGFSFMDWLTKLNKGTKGATGKSLGDLGLMGAGLLLNKIGSSSSAKANQNQAKDNLASYLKEATWTPEKTSNYITGIRNNAAGIYGKAANKAKGTVSAQLASAGRGGGSYGNRANSIDRDFLEKMAEVTNSAITETSKPSNVSPGLFNIPADASSGDFMKSFSGLLAEEYKNKQTNELLAQLFKSLGA